MCLKTTDKRRFKSQLSSEEFFRNNERFHDTNEFNENNVAERKEVAAYLLSYFSMYSSVPNKSPCAFILFCLLSPACMSYLELAFFDGLLMNTFGKVLKRMSLISILVPNKQTGNSFLKK